MEHKDLSTGQLSDLKAKAEQSVVEKDGKFTVQFDNPPQGFDTSKPYDNRSLAIDAAFNALKKSPS